MPLHRAALHRTSLRSQDGTGHVRLDWEPAEGTLGYVVHRSDHYEGPFEPIDATGVCLPPYADTLVAVGHGYWYRVAARTGSGAQPPGPETVRGCARARGAEPATVHVRIDVDHPAEHDSGGPPGAPVRVRVRVTGDGAGCLVTATATRTPDAAGSHTVEVLLANSAPDRAGSAPMPLLERRAAVEVSGVGPGARYYAVLRQDDRPADPLGALAAGPDGRAHVSLTLPMPGRHTLQLTGI